MVLEPVGNEVPEIYGQADQLGLVGHQHQLHAVAYREAGDHRPVTAGIAGLADIRDALAAAPDGAVFVGRGDLAVAVGGKGQDELLVLLHRRRDIRVERVGGVVVLPYRAAQICLARFHVVAERVEHGEADDLVAFLQLHAAHADAGTALGLARVGSGEADRLARVRGEENLLILVQQAHADQPVAAAFDEAHRVFSVRRDIGEGIHRVAPDHTLFGRKDDVELAPLRLVLRQGEHVGHALVLAQRQQVDHRAALGGRATFGQLPHLHAIDAARIGEEQHRVVGAGDEHLDHRILVLGRHRAAALAAARLRAEGL